jgi:PEP-CTERM motif
MTMARSLWTLAAAAGVAAMGIGAVRPAEAGTVVVPSSITFIATGTIKTGVDPADLFGGGDLSGLPYVASYTFQTSPSTSPPYYCCVVSSTGPGGAVSELNPATSATLNVSATITVNGDTFALSGTGNASNAAFSVEDERALLVDGKTSGGIPASLGTVVARIPPLWFGIPGATDLFDDNTLNGVTGGGGNSEFAASDGTFAFLNVSSISQHLDGTMEVPIPEPSTWVMLLLGFAGLGYAGLCGRRRIPAGAELGAARH